MAKDIYLRTDQFVKTIVDHMVHRIFLIDVKGLADFTERGPQSPLVLLSYTYSSFYSVLKYVLKCKNLA